MVGTVSTMGKAAGKRKVLIAATLLAAPLPAAALSISFADGSITGDLNSTVTIGAAMRVESRAADLVGKANLDPNLCGGSAADFQYQSCQGVFKQQIYPAARLADSPGQYTMRADDGNLNYDQGDLTSAIAKITQDLTLRWDNFGLFARWLYFYDFVNNDFDEVYPNVITAQNSAEVGISGDVLGALGDGAANRYFERVYGPGRRETMRRSDGATLEQIGTDFQLLDFNIFGSLPIPFTDGKEFTFKIGRQTLNWGESTTLVVNSLNQINPPNANNLYRVGYQLEEVFQPQGMAYLSFEPFGNGTMELFYQYEWDPLEIPAAGSYFSYNDLGSDNAVDRVNLSFGGSADDFDGTGYPLNSPLALITPTTARSTRTADRNPDNGGQYGASFKYYFEELNSGTEVGLYFMNYHSRLPYVSFTSTDASCARREGNSLGIDATNTMQFFAACDNLPAYQPRALAGVTPQLLTLLTTNPGVLADLGGSLSDLSGLLNLLTYDPDEPLSDAVPLQTGEIFFEYPEDIQMYGISFNTASGDYSYQGEIAYRPNLPLQVAIVDLEFAAAGPTLTRCHDPVLGCAGATAGRGTDEDGNQITYGRGDWTDANGEVPYFDAVNLIVGGAPGSARSFPNFIIPYRGGVAGENPPNSYIRGYERFDVLQYNLGVTRVLSSTENWIAADQIQLVGELGATHVPGLPDLDVLQIEGPGVYTHASAGADGSGADGSQQACGPRTAANASCVVNYDANGDGDYNDEGDVYGDGARFNPHQANLDDFADKFAWGYRLIAIIKYESVLPGISVQPFILFGHDVDGTAPGPAENFVEHRKQAQVVIETRYREALTLGTGYGAFWGGGSTNLLRDRDFAQLFIRYQF